MDGPKLQEKIDFRMYGRILYKRRWTIATFFLIVVTLVTLTTMVQTPIYEATAILQIEPAPPEVVPFKDVVTLGSQSIWANKEYFQTQFWILRSEALAMEVVEVLDLTNTDPFFASNPNAAKTLSKMVRVRPIKNSQLVQLSLLHPDSEQAALICNTLAAKYQTQNVNFEAKKFLRDKIAESLEERRQDGETGLMEAENELLDFMKENNIISFEGHQNIIQSRLTALSEALTNANRKRVEAQAAYSKAKDLQYSGKGLQLPEVNDNSLIMELKEQKIILEKEYAKLSSKYLEKNPKMIKLSKQLELLDNKINEEINNIVGSFRAVYLIAMAKEKKLEGAVDEAKLEAQALNEKAISYGVLRRKVDTESEIYAELIRRVKETNVMKQLNTTNISIRELADVPKSHIKPKRKTNVLLSMILGIFGGVAIAFLLEYMDTRIKNQDDLEKATGLPFLGIIPSFSADEPEYNSELFTHDFPKSSITESIRAIRTNITFSAHTSDFSKLLVTSAGPQEGKSTTVINLGIIFAQVGKKVLIIDSDLRRPRIHKAFNVTRGKGLTSFIMEEAAAGDVVIDSGVPNLSIIPCGPIPPNPSELLGSSRMDEVIAELESMFDIILFDSPPIVAVTDAVVLSKNVDGVVLIVKSGKTTAEMVTKATRQLSDVKSSILGTVLNDFNIKGEGYRYYYYYRYYRREDGEQIHSKVKKKKRVKEMNNNNAKETEAEVTDDAPNNNPTE